MLAIGVAFSYTPPLEFSIIKEVLNATRLLFHRQENQLRQADHPSWQGQVSRLSLKEDDLQRLTDQLESILGYVDKLSEVDVTGVEPTAHALPLHNVLREDVVEPSLPLEKVLRNAPDVDGRFFKVPKIIGGDEDSAS